MQYLDHGPRAALLGLLLWIGVGGCAQGSTAPHERNFEALGESPAKSAPVDAGAGAAPDAGVMGAEDAGPPAPAVDDDDAGVDPPLAEAGACEDDSPDRDGDRIPDCLDECPDDGNRALALPVDATCDGQDDDCDGSFDEDGACPPVMLLQEHFDGLDRWSVGGDPSVGTRAMELMTGYAGGGNPVVNGSACAEHCQLELQEPIDMAPYARGELTVWRFLQGRLDAANEEGIWLYGWDGDDWVLLVEWTAAAGHNDSRWHPETLELDERFLHAGFKLRLSFKANGSAEYAQLDDLVVTGSY